MVYTENKKGVLYPLISENAKSRGWILMDNLLLWSSCPTNEVGIYNKAFLAINYDEAKKRNADIGKYYQNPLTKDNPKSHASDMNFFFVMKKADNGVVLLAREHRMEGYSHSVLYGWVTTASLVLWDNRICLEPNWKPSVIKELKGKRVKIYINGINPIDVKLGESNRITQDPKIQYRWRPQRVRYPLLGDNPNNEKQYSIIMLAKPPGILDDAMTRAYYGYTDKKDESTGFDYWLPVVLISSDEFAQLMEKLQPVMSAANKGNRKPYVDAIKELTRSMIPDITPKEMNEKDVKEIMALVMGLNVKSGLSGGRTLAQILDETIVEDEEFVGMIANFQNKFRKLKKIRENKYDFSIERNKTTWYWIPVEDLP